MHTGPTFRHATATSGSRLVAILTAGVSALAAAQAVPTIGKVGELAEERVPWHGSSVSYGVAATALTFTPDFELTYNPTVAHRIGITPQWHFNDDFFVSGRFFLSQEFTKSDFTNSLHEVELSDLWLDANWAGWKEKHSGIKVQGGLRFVLPTSKVSQAQGRVLRLSPGASLSRAFPVLSGLIFQYTGRFTYRFNRFDNFQNQGPTITRCGLGGADDCPSILSTGVRAIQFDVFHGPTVVFLPHPRVILAATFFMQYGYLPKLQATDATLSIDRPNSPEWRNFWGSAISATWQTWDTIAFTLGAFTFSNQLDLNSRYVVPLFNRNTVISLDMTVDIESLVSNVKPKEKS